MIKALLKYKVILIGGSPMVGKTTLAKKFASQLEYACISTDDIGEALRAQFSDKKYNPMLGWDYQQYYILNTIEQLIDETKEQHQAYKKSIFGVINAHINWGQPIIVEGWNLYPNYVKELNDERVFSIWLIARKELFIKRISENFAFIKNATNKQLLIDNFTDRSLWHTSVIENQLSKLNIKGVILETDDSVNTMMERVKINVSKRID